jgi:PAS domain S-box-containing protein
MNIFTLLSLISSISCLLLGLIVFHFNRKSTLNKIFLLTALAAFVYAFTTVMMWNSTDFSSANLWNKMGTIWPFFVALVATFALVFTENKWLSNKLNYLIIFLPAVVFWLVDLSTNLINAPPVMEYWGYNDVASGTWLYYVSLVWTSALPILAFVLCLKYYRKAEETADKQRRKFVTIGFAIPIATFIGTNIIARSLNLGIPNLGFIATLFFSILVGYAIAKYELFSFDEELAAERILSVMPDSLILADMKTNILSVNERLINFTGYKKGELIGLSITKLCAENEEKTCKKIMELLVAEKIIRNHELVLKNKSGTKINVLFSASIIPNKSGRSIGIACIIHDITDMKKMEERLVQVERLASIGELAGQIGHDLRNPLAAIKNAVYILNKKNELMTPVERKEILACVDTAIEDSDRIICSLIDYSCDLCFKPTKCTLKSLMQSVLSKFKVPDRIKVVNDVSDETNVFLGKQYIEKVFDCILKNAIEAIPETGIIQIGSMLKESKVEISFADSGIGIPERVLPKIFAPLVTTKAKGMGMSLAICKRIVEAHGGKVSFESSAVKGTTFTISLPIKLSKNEFPQIQAFTGIEVDQQTIA